MINDIFEKYSNHIEFLDRPIKSVHDVGLFGSRILHLAAFNGNVSDVALILKEGGEIDVQGDMGLTPLHYAVLGDHISVVKILLEEGADVKCENEFFENPIQMAHILKEFDIEEFIKKFSGLMAFEYSDGAGYQRWIDFKEIQKLNFSSFKNHSKQ